MGLNFLHVSDHNWAEKMFTDMRNRTMAYLERKDRSLILAPLLTTLEKGIKTYTVFPHIVSPLEYFPPLNSFRSQKLLIINSFLP